MYEKIRFALFFFLIIHSSIAQSEFSAPEKITIYWDTSLSMMGRDVTKEVELLDTYFTNLQNVEVELVKFSNGIEEETKFKIINGDWSSLKGSLMNTKYDGIAFFDTVLQKRSSEINLLFTDGISTLDALEVSTKKPSFLINSSLKANHKLLRKQGIRSQGNYINLNEVTIEQSMSLLKVSVKNVAINPGNINSDNDLAVEKSKEKTITGIIYGPNGVLKDAAIMKNNNVVGAISDESGRYKIMAKEGDLLTVSFIGMQTQETKINKLYEIDFHLINIINPLDEVVVQGQGIIEEEEEEDTAHGKRYKKKLGYAVQSIDDKDISPTITDVSNATQGKFSVANNGSNDDISRMVTRGFTSLSFNSFPLIVIDNVPTIRVTNTSASSVNFLRSLVDPNNIAKITILKGLSASNAWGSEGKNGVILITTKTASHEKTTTGPNTGAGKRNNLYTESLNLANTTISTPYVEALKKFNTLNEAYDSYLEQRREYYDDPNYFINVSDYIMQRGNRGLASKILANLLEINEDNIQLLKLVAYKAEQNYDYTLAKKVYEKIAKLRPKDAQSYRDLALIYQETGHYQKAMDIYDEIKKDRIAGVDFSGLQKNIESEYNRLITLHKEAFKSTETVVENSQALNYDARIVFEWNDPNAEFELQFVNPQKLFFTWPHTRAKDAARMDIERNQGFNSEEFLLIDAPKGEWLINLDNKTKKKTKTPVLIKYTVYYNYGKSNESRKLKTILLHPIKGKQMIAKVVI